MLEVPCQLDPDTGCLYIARVSSSLRFIPVDPGSPFIYLGQARATERVSIEGGARVLRRHVPLGVLNSKSERPHMLWFNDQVTYVTTDELWSCFNIVGSPEEE